MKLNTLLISAALVNNADEVRICLMCGKIEDPLHGVWEFYPKLLNSYISTSAKIFTIEANSSFVTLRKPLVQTKWKADVNSRSVYDSQTVLMIAASRGYSDIVRILLVQGASVNARDSEGNFAIHLAAVNGHLECVKLLMDKRCLANVGNNRYRTPLMVAAAKGHTTIVNHFLDKGVNMAYQLNKNLESELTLAAKHNHLEVVKILLNRANTDIDRSTELNEAYSNALLSSTNEMIETLLSAGADANYFEIPDILPLFIAIGRRSMDLVKTLQRYGVDHNQVDRDGYNALMYAVLLENFEAVEYFISIGADLNVRTSKSNLTAIGLAENGEDGRILEILKEAQRPNFEK
ncbi:hypothetical protein ACTXT7_015631 [Hymenolepis weldensis]